MIVSYRLRTKAHSYCCGKYFSQYNDHHLLTDVYFCSVDVSIWFRSRIVSFDQIPLE